jgi:hypothetical protein
VANYGFLGYGNLKFVKLVPPSSKLVPPFREVPDTSKGRDSSVGIATRYRLDGPGIESRWGRDFPHPSRSAPGAYPASCIMGTGSFRGGGAVKLPGRGADHPPPHLSAEIMKGYSYTSTHSLGLRGPLYGEPLPYPIPPSYGQKHDKSLL